MARGRIIYPDFWTDPVMVRLSPLARLFYIGMWNYACDQGHIPANPDELMMKILPRESVDPNELIGELVSRGRLETIQLPDLRSFFVIRTIPRWQKADKRFQSRCPVCKHTNSLPSLGENTETLPITELREGKGREEKKREGEASDDAPPPPHCGKHSENSDEPCGACKRARLRREQWDRDHQPPPPEAMWDCAKNRHKWVAGNTCALCGEIKEAG